MTKTNPPPQKLPRKFLEDPEVKAFMDALVKSVFLLWKHSRTLDSTAAETTITHTAPGTADYAIQDLTNSSAYGFVSKDEGNTVLQVVKNLQTRMTEIENHLSGQ